MPSDFYTLLGVAHNASSDEIKKQYKKLAIKYHPDKTQDKHHHEKFLRIQEAYDTLKDDESRQKYNAKVGLANATFSRSGTSFPFSYGSHFGSSQQSAFRDAYTHTARPSTSTSYYGYDVRFNTHASHYARSSRPTREEAEREEQKNAEKLHNMVNERMKEDSRRRQEEYIRQARKKREEEEARAMMEEALRQKQQNYQNQQRRDHPSASAQAAYAKSWGHGDARTEYESAREAAHRRAREAEMHAYSAMYGSKSYEERGGNDAEYIVVDDEEGQGEAEDEEEMEDEEEEESVKQENQEQNQNYPEAYEDDVEGEYDVEEDDAEEEQENDEEEEQENDEYKGGTESPERNYEAMPSAGKSYFSREGGVAGESETESRIPGQSQTHDEIRAWRAGVEPQSGSASNHVPQRHSYRQYADDPERDDSDGESEYESYGDAGDEFEKVHGGAGVDAPENGLHNEGTVPPDESTHDRSYASFASANASPQHDASHTAKRRPVVVDVSEDSGAESGYDTQTRSANTQAYMRAESPATAPPPRREETRYDEKPRATHGSAKKPRLANYDGMKNTLHTYLDDVDFSDFKSTLPDYSQKARKASTSNAPPSPKRPRYAEYADGNSKAETLHTPVNKTYSRRTTGTISTSDLSPHMDDSALIFSVEVPALTVQSNTTKTEWDAYVVKINEYERKFSLYRKAIFEYQIGRYEKDERHHNIIYSDTSCLDVHQSCLFNDILLLQNYTRALEEFRRTLKTFSVNCDTVNKMQG